MANFGKFFTLGLIIINVCVISFAQIFFKLGSKKMGALIDPGAKSKIASLFVNIFTNSHILFGIPWRKH